MSRRDSRASLGGRHNDALYEFEAFKKKFLLANKHITKLNSTLSVRIEELNAQIHVLNVENLRLRTAEIQLTSELKREREKSRKVMTDAEAATQSLTRHLNYLRKSLDIPLEVPTPPTPPSPKARRRPADGSPSSPQGLRIARPPDIPGIDEEDEEEEEPEKKPSPKRKSKSHHRLSASNLPLPTNRVMTPPPPPVVHMDLSVALTSNASSHAKRKPLRRQSGLLSIHTEGDSLSVPRPASPAFGSPIRLQAGRAELEEEIAIVDEEEPPIPPVKDKKRRREFDDTAIVTVEAVPFKPKSGRMALQPIDNTVRVHTEDPAELLFPPNERGSSTTPEPESVNGRERRARKSVVSYAEPSLKVKMRKPDSGGAPEPQKKKRSSTAAPRQRGESPLESTTHAERRSSIERDPGEPSSSLLPPDDDPTMSEAAAAAAATLRRRKSRQQQVYHVEDDDDDSDGAEADAEYMPPGTAKKGWPNVNAEGRRKPGKKVADGEIRRHSMAV